MAIMPQTKNFADIYIGYLQRIKAAAKGGGNKPLKTMINDAQTENKLYSTDIETFYFDVHYSCNDQTSYFLLADLPKTLSALKASPAKEILQFRHIISANYEGSTISLASEDYIREFFHLLDQALTDETSQFFDRIAFKQATWLRGDLERILKRYPKRETDI